MPDPPADCVAPSSPSSSTDGPLTYKLQRNPTPSEAVKRDTEEDYPYLVCKSDFLRDLYSDDTYSDFVIRCGDKEFKVHKCVVCKASTVFASIFKHGTIETATNAVIHEEFDAPTLQRLLSHVYTFLYDVSSSTVCENILEHVQVFLAADYYDIEDLKNLALRRLDKCISALHTTFDADGFIPVIPEIFKHSNLRETAIYRAAINLAIRYGGILIRKSAFIEVLRHEELEEFATLFLRSSVGASELTENHNRKLQSQVNNLTQENQALRRWAYRVPEILKDAIKEHLAECTLGQDPIAECRAAHAKHIEMLRDRAGSEA